MKDKLHIGCGGNIIPGWDNLDLNPGVGGISYDARLSLPYDDNSISLIYEFHFFEHLDYTEGLFHLKECYRVLQKSGIIRVCVPDMDKHLLNYNDYLKSNDPTLWRDSVNAVGVDEFNNFFKGNVKRILLGNINISEIIGEHKSLYTAGLLACRLLLAGFDNIYHSSNQASISTDMCGNYFDGKEEFTLFMEAIKEL